MGAGDWVAGSLRRAVSQVVSVLPGQGGGVPGTDVAGGPVATPPADPPAPTAAEPRREATAEPSAPAAPHAPPAAPDPAQSSDRAAAATAWTPEELAEFRAALDEDVARLRAELDTGEADLADLIADSADGAGDDQADAGSKTFEREHEMSVNANTREMIEQDRRALRRLDEGTYGMCESCGERIGAGRLRAFPRATLCIACKQAEERR